MGIHPIAALHARSLRHYDALQIALLDRPEQLGFEGPDGELSRADKANLIAACKAMTYTCSCCAEAKPPTAYTRDSAGCGELCEACYDYAGWENTHSDYDHASEPDAACPVCAEEGLVAA